MNKDVFGQAEDFILLYKILYSEILSELSCKDFLSSNMKITCYLHMWRAHCCYGYIINCAFESKLIWYFTGVYIINRILHTHLWIWILSSCVKLNISLVRYVHLCEISCWPLKDKIHIHVRACNILYTSPEISQVFGELLLGLVLVAVFF